MGPLTSEQSEMFAKNPRFIGLKFPAISNPETLEKKYVGKLPQKAISLMQGMLKMDPQQRITVFESLTHPYFDELRLNDPDFLSIIQDEQSVDNNDIMP